MSNLGPGAMGAGLLHATHSEAIAGQEARVGAGTRCPDDGVASPSQPMRPASLEPGLGALAA